jgi:hypothetical protein
MGEPGGQEVAMAADGGGAPHVATEVVPTPGYQPQEVVPTHP